ncbi:hypothetical protein [Priestia taiwanensis]|uniref:Uncharacterized protein n=1 Tax=Priestia taiwanensis TaxID=1347902 RepID=A0A917AZH5_9BACI|nr:hypothetical protein [Priestia taiwanensis]MBM7365263.1 hypothetical protein [Priestia taiwanensis]GGE85702.1 hypothetical protein GCM10007140_38850 [Priestia taiwanensis]
MTIVGYLFWGICLLAIALGFFMQKKWGTKAPVKNSENILDEEIARNTHNSPNSNDHPWI